jgi:hypothetical protein
MPAKLAFGLLRVNRSVYDEAANVLYGQPMIFADMKALTNLLIQIGPRECSRLRDITIKQWNYSSSLRSLNAPCMTMLAAANGLRRLNFDCPLGDFRPHHLVLSKADLRKDNCAAKAARMIFKDCYPFLESWAKAGYHANGGDRCEARDPSEIIELHSKNLVLHWPPYSSDAEPRSTEGEMAKFRHEIRRLIRKYGS